MKKNIVFTTIMTTTMAAAIAFTSFLAPCSTMRVSANDGTGIYAEKNLTVKDLNEVVTITADSANVREGVGKAYRILNTFDKGTKLHITGVVCRDGEETGWYCVNVTDKTYGGETGGFIHESTFTVDKKDNKQDDVAGTKMTVTGTKNYLGLRTEACDNDDKEIAKLYNGDNVIVLRNEGKYAYVYSENLGLVGYVKAAYLK